MKTFSKMFVAGTVALLSTAVPAADKQADLQWYLVELVVFNRIDTYALANETWLEDDGVINDKGVIELIPAQGDARTNIETEPVQETARTAPSAVTKPAAMAATAAEEKPFYPEAFQMLYADELQLTDKVERLRNSREYHVLLHTAWYQPAFESRHKRSVYLHDNLASTEEVSPASAVMAPTPLAADSATPAAVEFALNMEEIDNPGPLNQRLFGTFRLGISRYLHAYFDLIYRIPREVTYHEEMDMLKDAVYLLPPDTEFSYQTQPVTTVAMTNFRLKESRRIKSRELHYFDHPAFGVLLYVTPYEFPQENEKQ